MVELERSANCQFTWFARTGSSRCNRGKVALQSRYGRATIALQHNPALPMSHSACQRETRLNRRGARFANRRSGFTLLEILLVLAVFVAITAMAVPAVTGIFSGQQMRSAADIVRARLADARVRAIKTGDVYAFFYQRGGGDYWVAPMNTGFQSLTGGAAAPSFQHTLENEIIFSAGETMQDARSAHVAENGSRQFASWRPVLFYPDGTSQDATILLRSKTGLQMEVNLRGLTGVASRSLSPSGSEARQ